MTLAHADVRTATRDRWAAALAAIPFLDVVNRPTDQTQFPDLWGTAAFNVDQVTDLTLGSNPDVIETGVASLFIFARSGEGDAAAIAAGDQVRAAFLGFYRQVPSGFLVFETCEGPVDTEPQASGDFYGVQFDARYSFMGKRP